MAVDTDRQQTATRLLRASVTHTYDPLVEVDWSAPPVPGLPYVPLHRVSLYGTPLWDRLDHDQRVELSRHEVASMASVGVWFETILMQMLVRRYYHQDPASAQAQYALTEVADECRHSVMFGKMIENIGCPSYRLNSVDRALGTYLRTGARGADMFSTILLAEEIFDALQRENAADEGIQPIIRRVCHIHVVEEARHVRYAREELERHVRTYGRARLAYSRLLIARAAYLMGRGLIRPEVYRSVGIDPAQGRRAALANPHYRETLRWAAHKGVTMLRDMGLVAGPGMRWWRGSGLV